MSQACHQVFSSPVRTIIFGDFLGCDRQLSQVSRAFCEANRNALIKVGDQIAHLGPRTRDQMLEFERAEHPEARLPQLIAVISGKIEGDLENEGAKRVGSLWNAVIELRKQSEREENPEVRRLRVFNLVTHLEAFDRDFERWVRDDALLKHLEELVVRDRIAKRFANVIAERPVDPHNPQQITECFAALHASQNVSCRSTRALESLPKPATNSLQEFHRLEKRIFDLESESQDLGLHDLWRSLRPMVNGPDLRSAYLIRNWMNDLVNAAGLANVQDLEIGDPERFSQIPSEIGKLTGLRALRWGGYAEDDESRDGWYRPIPIPNDYRTLPEEFANLRQLEALWLDGNGFSEIPAVLGRLPALQILSLYRHQLPIRVFADALERQLNSGFGRLLLTILASEYFNCERLLSGHHFFLSIGLNGLDSEELTDIPFRVWFRTYCSIPNIPVTISVLAYELGLRCIGEGFMLSCAAIAAFALAVLFLPLAVPFVVANMAIQLGLEPVVTFVRDKLGYSRMVHVRDLPVA